MEQSRRAQAQRTGLSLADANERFVKQVEALLAGRNPDYFVVWLKQPKGSAEISKGFGENSQTITNTNSATTNKTDSPKAPKGAEPGFDEFWSAYPNKVGKPKALALWNRLKPDLPAVMAGLKRWKASDQWTKDGGPVHPPSDDLAEQGKGGMMLSLGSNQRLHRLI
ncbi:hypothetical protein [Rhizobium binxianense]|uniref:hypothetical protein n=1 Tax=Rhizobium binxianense TaxID=3024242 RepID=UPI00235EF970|nr:hypothetical protein [Rhizobium sp. MJ37]MDC9835546.1 hypothetical protein [Rhizobium sp. MJ37]